MRPRSWFSTCLKALGRAQDEPGRGVGKSGEHALEESGDLPDFLFADRVRHLVLVPFDVVARGLQLVARAAAARTSGMTGSTATVRHEDRHRAARGRALGVEFARRAADRSTARAAPASGSCWRRPVCSVIAPPCEKPASTMRERGVPRATSRAISASTCAAASRGCRLRPRAERGRYRGCRTRRASRSRR